MLSTTIHSKLRDRVNTASDQTAESVCSGRRHHADAHHRRGTRLIAGSLLRPGLTALVASAATAACLSVGVPAATAGTLSGGSCGARSSDSHPATGWNDTRTSNVDGVWQATCGDHGSQLPSAGAAVAGHDDGGAGAGDCQPGSSATGSGGATAAVAGAASVTCGDGDDSPAGTTNHCHPGSTPGEDGDSQAGPSRPGSDGIPSGDDHHCHPGSGQGDAGPSQPDGGDDDGSWSGQTHHCQPPSGSGQGGGSQTGSGGSTGTTNS